MNMNRGTQTITEPELGVGDVIGRYRLIGSIAEGSAGRLYVAEQSNSDGTDGPCVCVAVRCIRPQLAQRPGFRERLLEAAQVVGRCVHPNIGRVLEIAEDQGRYYVSLEHVPGESLATILASPELGAAVPPDIAAHLVKRVASAMLHARAVRDALSLPSSERVAEVVAEDSDAHGPALDPSDVFVTHAGTVQWLGVALPPAPRQTDADALGQLLWTLVPSTRSDVPPALAAIVARAAAADPSERFPSLEALSQALDRYFFGQEFRPTPAHLRRWLEGLTTPQPRPLWSASARPSVLPSTRRWPRWQWLTAVALALALAVGTALAALAQAPKRPERAEARVDVRSTPPDAAIFVDGEPTGLRTPVLLQGLPANRQLQVRVVKAGFTPQQRRVALATDSVQTLVYELVASDGLVAIAGAPRGSRLYVDGEEVALQSQTPLSLPVGTHAIRVEVAGALVFSDRVLVVPGEQTIRVTQDRAAR